MTDLIVGYGVQGKKRFLHSRSKKKIIVDPVYKFADFKDILKVPLNSFENAYICVPEKYKFQIIKYLIENKKNILVEKPLLLKKNQYIELTNLQKNNKACLYTAYNHRFEPHLIKIKKLLSEKYVGKVYSVSMYYGNGTVNLWKNSWRSKNRYSILYDLGVHLLDTYLFCFEGMPKKINIVQKGTFEVGCIDFCVMTSNKPFILNMTTSIIDWKNKFKTEIIGSKGSIHMDGLCKWGPSLLKVRKRKLPVGRPDEKIYKIIKKDPTWKSEENFFKSKINKNFSNIKNDLLIDRALRGMIKK